MKYFVKPEKQSGIVKTTRTLWSFFVIAFMTMALISNAQSPEVRKAYRLIDIEQPTKGIAALEQIAGQSAANQYYLGLAYLRTGGDKDKALRDKALASFEKGISMGEKREGLNLAGKGHVKLLENKPVEAKALFEQALDETRSKDANVWRAIGEAYLSDSKYVLDAINALKKAESIDAANPETHIVLGDAYLKQNNGGESVNSYERAASADKSFAKPYVKIAEVYSRSKNYDMVFENLNKAISVDPEYAPAYKELGELYYVRKEADKAVEAMEKYLPITEFKDEAKAQYAFFLFMAKNYAKANQMFKEISNSPNASPTVIKYRALALAESDTTQAGRTEAQNLFAQYFQKQKPEAIQAADYAYYGRLLLLTKQDSLANESFAQSLEMDSAQADVLQLQADTYFKRKKYAEAAETYKELMSQRKQPLSQDLWSIGRAYYFGGQYAEADTAFTQLSERQPKVIHGYLWAAKSRAQVDSTGSQGIAVPMYEKFIEIASASPEKYKRDLVDAYDYMGQYALHQKKNVAEAKTYFDKVLQLDPKNERAQEFMNILKEAAQQQKGGR